MPDLGRVTALGRVRLGEVIAVVVLLGEGAVERLLKDGLGVNNLKLGPKVPGVMRDGAAVGAATGIGKGKVLVGNLFMEGAPVTLASAVLFDLFGIDIGVATLGKVTGQMLDRESGAFGDALVVAVVGLVRASHDGD